MFDSVEHAQQLATEWLWTYNNERPSVVLPENSYHTLFMPPTVRNDDANHYGAINGTYSFKLPHEVLSS